MIGLRPRLGLGIGRRRVSAVLVDGDAMRMGGVEIAIRR